MVVTIFKGDTNLPFSGKTIHLGRPHSKRLYDWKGWKEFKHITEQFKPDIVQANAADTLKFAVSSKFLYKWNSRIVFRNANKMGDFIDSKVKWQLNRFYISQIDYTISVSKECEKDFKSTFPYPAKNIKTVEIGVEKKKVGGIPQDLKKIFRKGPVLTHIGGFVPEKNHAGLIRIFSNVLKELPEIQLVLIGKGELQEEIRKSTEELGINDQVHFLNYRNDVLEILSHSKAFVMPSLIEGLPAVILEAMYCKTPVVAYNVGGIGEVVHMKSTGWLVEKGDEVAFQMSIKEVLTDEERVEKKITAAKDMIFAKFMNDKIARRFAETYQELLHKNECVSSDSHLSRKSQKKVTNV